MTITNGYSILADAKNLLRIETPHSVDDGVIEQMVEHASRVIDRLSGRTFYSRTETHYYDVPHGRSLFIDDDDLLTISTLTNGDGTIITSADYKIYPRNTTPKWEIRLNESSSIVWSPDANGNTEGVITVAGGWGFASVAPGDIVDACLDIVVSAYHRRAGENISGQATITAAGVVITPQDIPSKAAAIIKAYRRTV